MECYYHSSKQAVGLCRSCNKAVCRDCAKIIPKGLACCDECVVDAQELIEMNERGKKLYGIGKFKTNRLATVVVVWLLLAGVMWVCTALVYFGRNEPDYGTLAMAVIFTIIAGIMFRSSKRTGLQC